MGFRGSASGKESAYQCKRHKRRSFAPWVGKIPWRRKWQLTLVFLPGEFMDRGAWKAPVHRVAESDVTEVTQHARTVYYQCPSPSLSHAPLPAYVYMSVLYVCISIPALQIRSSVPFC